MKKIWTYVKNHLREDFNAGHYSIIFLFLSICLYANYAWDLKRNYINTQTGMLKTACYFAFYSFAYYFSIASYAIFYKQHNFYRDKKFWIRSLFFLFFLSFDASQPFLRQTINTFVDDDLQYWLFKVIFNLSSLFTIVLPLLIFYFINDRKSGHLYGLQIKQFDPKPYFIMLLIMMPLIITASFDKSFLRQYPMCPSTTAHLYFDVPEWLTNLMYEISYGLDFVSVEFMFRGFMVMAFISIFGRSAVLTMAVVYCFLHFSKPAGEAISSIFGGYILGVVAYETRSVWGGIIVHVGIAWMMELMAFIHEW